MRVFHALLIMPVLLAPVSGCTVNPATGQSQFTAFMSPAEERRVGAQEHPKLVQQFGGEYSDAELKAYIQRVGQAVARYTETPEIPYTFTLLDDELVNAFALPGGYVHITRGLLALASNEAEVAGVLGHETGHVVARHSAERYSQTVAAQLGLGVLGVLGAAAGLPAQTGDLAAYGAQAYLQGYSREQELEADQLGVRYMARAGYDPQAMVSFFRKMDAFTRLQATMAGDPEAASRFSIMASHPKTADRVQQAIQLARATPVANPKEGEAEFLAAIDGMIYGDTPDQGVRRGRDFSHPGLRIAFRAPPGFVMFNSPKQLTGRGPNNTAMVFDSENDRARAQTASMTTYVGQVWGGKLGLQRVEAIQVNGMEGATATTRVRTRDGGVVDLRLAAIREAPGRIYRFLFISPPEVTGRLDASFQATISSFRRLTAAEAQAIKPLRIRIVTVKAGDTPQSMAARMAVDSYPLEHFLVLNGLQPGDSLRPGDKVKIISE